MKGKSLTIQNKVLILVSSGLLLTAVSNFAAPVAPVRIYQSKTSSQISLQTRDNLIVATTVTDWDPKASETLYVRWIAPKDGFCKSSRYTVVRGDSLSGDTSWSYRTVIHTGSKGETIVCAGQWIAEVINGNSGRILSAAGYTVKADGASSPVSTTSS